MMRLAVLCMLVACGATGQTLHVGGRDRGYILHLPARPPAGTMPLVIAFHGGGGNAGHMVRASNMNALADREGFAVVYPESVNGYWNDGSGGDALPVDDVGFIRALIDHLVATYPIDRGAVFATGMSNGGMMSYRLGCELADKIAAIAPVAGGIGEPFAPSCHPVRPVSVIAMNGTADPIVRWQGGPVHVFTDHGTVLGAEASAELMATVDGCTGEPSVMWEPDRDPSDGTTVRRTDYGTCDGGSTVELLAINGGGHTWPGGRQNLPIGLVGRVSRELSASQQIWEFFRSHARSQR